MIKLVQEPARGSADGAPLLRKSDWFYDVRQIFRMFVVRSLTDKTSEFCPCSKSFILITLGFTWVAFAMGSLAWWAPKFLQNAYALYYGKDNESKKAKYRRSASHIVWHRFSHDLVSTSISGSSPVLPDWSVSFSAVKSLNGNSTRPQERPGTHALWGILQLSETQCSSRSHRLWCCSAALHTVPRRLPDLFKRQSNFNLDLHFPCRNMSLHQLGVDIRYADG